MSRSLRFAFLDSWHSDPERGSGTAVGITGLARALEFVGHRVEMIRPTRTGRGLANRILFNISLRDRVTSGHMPDVVVGFDLDGFRWARRRPRGLPYVVALKGIAADEARFERSARQRWLLRSIAALERRNAAHADGILVPSRYSRQCVVDYYRIPPTRVEVIPEAVDLRPWRTLARQYRGEGARNRLRPPTVLSVARQYPRKDTRTLLRAMKIVVERYPTVRLAVIGGGPELRHLGCLSNELGLNRHVSFRGPVARDHDVRTAYFEADVFCLPSRQEGFGIVFVEAMAAGLPVVAARAGAVPEVVRHGRTGLLVPPSDPDALATALISLLKNPEKRRRLGAAGPRVAERYGLGTVGRDLVHGIRSLVDASHRAGPGSI